MNTPSESQESPDFSKDVPEQIAADITAALQNEPVNHIYLESNYVLEVTPVPKELGIMVADFLNDTQIVAILHTGKEKSSASFLRLKIDPKQPPSESAIREFIEDAMQKLRTIGNADLNVNLFNQEMRDLLGDDYEQRKEQ